MFRVIYEFDVFPGKEEEFQTLWRTITLQLKQKIENVGSCLHKLVNDQSKWIAYAKWPSREKWLEHMKLISGDTPPSWVIAMKSTCTVKVLFELTIVDDLI